MTGPILIMAGGTGGHVYPALAVADALRQRSYDVVWLGTRRGIEARVVPAAGFEIEWIDIAGLRRKGVLALVAAPVKIAHALIQSLSVMRRRRPAAVLGMGGFVSGPGGLAAWLMRRPLIVHEQNAIPGLTNRLLARLARVLLQAFPGSFSRNAETVGNPVRTSIAALAEPAERFRERSGPIRLLVLGGSQGALALNKLVPEAIAHLPVERRPEIRHQCGKRTADLAREVYRANDVDAEIIEFIDDMATAYGWADLVVCRAGALTVAELSAAGLAALFIPYPAAVDDHQTANATPFADAGAGRILQEAGLTAASLADAIDAELDRDTLLARSEKARSLSQPDALERIVRHCETQAGGAR